ncbi:hypothetical protein Strain138_002144 [Pseudogemmatithrix spongiicola]|uniref:Uncharacterized protein n=1 Tax=Pseudogemmatithrix spongiicola TaxID=3062599 RepID=A0AA49K186_9BACT|nr:hypothetical protein Strain138_002144 [Gemmatimonadaceae bacterium 'strain 138']WKW15741.1 hypothetical protein Strain318_002143 [Gemmatimonadaceae bacterium 'strain 318']
MSAKQRKTIVPLENGNGITVYSGAKVSTALEEVMADMTLYKGVKLSQVLEAVYSQGKKDGARDAFEKMRAGLEQAESAVPHRIPGRPKKRAAKKK